MAAGDRAEDPELKIEFTRILALPYQDGLSIEQGGGLQLDYFEQAKVARLAIQSVDDHGHALDPETLYVDHEIMDEVARSWLQWRINASDQLRNRVEQREQFTIPTMAQDIETARACFAELLAIEDHMTAASAQMRNPVRWLEALTAIWKAGTSLQRFIGERMTADIVQVQRAAHADQADHADHAGDGQATAPSDEPNEGTLE